MSGPVTITIYDALGNMVTPPVVEDALDGGDHQIVVETGELAAGGYICSVKGGGVERSVRFVVVR
jgi:hypothetical protein